MNIERPKSKQSIPAHAKRVFKGIIFDVYQWEQEMYDGSKQIFEKLKRPDTVMVFPVMDDGKIIITEQEQPGMGTYLDLPSGRVDEDEEILSAAKRELLEETGYEAGELILWHASQRINLIDWAVFVFIGKGLKKVSEPNPDAGEKIKLKTVSLDELIEMATSEKHKNVVDKETIMKFFEAKLDQNKKAELEELFKPLK